MWLDFYGFPDSVLVPELHRWWVWFLSSWCSGLVRESVWWWLIYWCVLVCRMLGVPWLLQICCALSLRCILYCICRECGKHQPCLVCPVCPCVFVVMLESCLVTCGISWFVRGWRCAVACVMCGRCMGWWWWTWTVVILLVGGLAWAGWSWNAGIRWVAAMSWCDGVPASSCVWSQCWKHGRPMCCGQQTWSVDDGTKSCVDTGLCHIPCVWHPGRRWWCSSLAPWWIWWADAQL